MKRDVILAAVLVCLTATLVPEGWCGNLVKVGRPAEDVDLKRLVEKRLDRWINAPVKDMRSRRDLLRARRRQAQLALGLAVQDTLRICGIRVEFESVPDPSKISGNGGRFDLSDRRGDVPIDPPPHDRKYFSKHMEALAYYYRAMSYGQLEIEWEVFPLANDGAYVLPDVGAYNPGGGVWTWDVEGLELFFRDAIEAADKDPELDFHDYDAVIVFHAGSDWQNDIYGDTPYDIPSYFISLAGSVAVEDSTHFIVDGSVVPETTTQDGYYNGINGVVAHEVGHQLGLPDLYDTYMGFSVVGYWDLMDYGSGVGVVIEDTLANEAYFVSGIIPTSLSAWSKTRLGWVVADTVRDEGSFKLEATEVQGDWPNREVLAIPINSYEYFLVENRQRDLDGDDTGFLLRDPSEDSTGVMIGPVDENMQFNYEFDFVLPGSGLLIWHVDGVWVDFLSPYDLVNAYPERRGIRLEEADGIPDLGDFNSFYFLGGPDDPFRRGNNDTFADDTYPNTRSNTGCHSHVVIDEIGDSRLSMDLHVSYSWTRRGFPIALGDSMRFGVPSLLISDLDGNGRDEIRSVLKRAYWGDSLEVIWQRSRIDAYELDENGDLIKVPGWPNRPHGSHPTELVGADLDGDGVFEVMFSDETGRLYAFTADAAPYFEASGWRGSFLELDTAINGVMVGCDLDEDGDDEAMVGTRSAFYIIGGSRDSLVVDTCLVAGDGGGFSQAVAYDFRPELQGKEVVYYSPGEIGVYSHTSGQVVTTLPLGCTLDAGDVYLAAADLDRADGDALEMIVVGKNGWVWVIGGEGAPLPGWGRRVCASVVSPPAFGDVNGDGYLEIILNDEDYRTWVVVRSGSGAQGWPRAWYGCSLPVWDEEFYPPDTTIAVPSALVADLDCDGALDVLQGSLFECIVGWAPGGVRSSGFPVSLGGGCSAAALGDLDGDGRLDLVAGGGDGHVYAFLHPDQQETCVAPWRTAYFDRSRNSVYPVDLMPDLPEPGNRLLVKGSFCAYPNPAGASYGEDGANEVSFRFETDTGGMAKVEVFDISGVAVKTVYHDATSQVPRVTIPRVDISDLASGLYVCRLSIEGNGTRVSEFFKLAVKR